MPTYLDYRYVGYLDTRQPSTPTPYIRCYPLHQRFLAVGDTGQKHGFNMRTRKPCYWTLIYPAFLICGKTKNARCAPMAQCQRATDLLTTIRFASLVAVVGTEFVGMEWVDATGCSLPRRYQSGCELDHGLKTLPSICTIRSYPRLLRLTM